MITADGLTREFTVTERAPGLRAALRSVAKRQLRTVTAIDEVSFDISGGGVTGFLGPNGSGKTTTLKCLAGLLTPTRGRVEVLGYIPSERDPEFLRQLGFVMGQRWQLNVDIPVLESFELHRVVYDLDSTDFRRTLDEPTLGLDFDAQQQIRTFVGAYVRLTGAAVLLTSHYLADIEALCHDVMTISRGRITYTGTLRELQDLAGDQKLITVRLSAPLPRDAVVRLGNVREHTDSSIVIEVPRGGAGEAVGVLEHLPGVADVSLADPPLEDTLRTLYDAPART